jgi:hypothetical protein
MFRVDQIITASQFVRHFRELAAYLARSNEPLLITQKNGRFLVVMEAEFFQGVLDAQAESVASDDADGAQKRARGL